MNVPGPYKRAQVFHDSKAFIHKFLKGSGLLSDLTTVDHEVSLTEFIVTEVKIKTSLLHEQKIQRSPDNALQSRLRQRLRYVCTQNISFYTFGSVL